MNDAREKNYAWICNQNLSRFEGEWVVVIDQQIVANGPNAAVVVKKSKKDHPGKRPFLVKVPKNVVITA